MKKVFLILFLLSFCLALLPTSCAVGAGFWYMKNKNWKEKANKIDGTVIELVESKNSDGHAMWSPVVEYSYQGKTKKYRSNQSSSPQPYDEGDTVTLLMNPDDSKDVCMDSTISLYGGAIALGISSLPFAFFTYPICFLFMILAIFIKKPKSSRKASG